MVTTVAFNDEEEAFYQELFDNKQTSRKFSQFVKDAFYDKIDALRAKANETSEEQP